MKYAKADLGDHLTFCTWNIVQNSQLSKYPEEIDINMCSLNVNLEETIELTGQIYIM